MQLSVVSNHAGSSGQSRILLAVIVDQGFRNIWQRHKMANNDVANFATLHISKDLEKQIISIQKIRKVHRRRLLNNQLTCITKLTAS